MSVTIFTFIVLLGGLIASEAGTITLLVLFSLFGAAAAINLPALGGAAITPSVLFLPFVVTRAMLKRARERAPLALSRAGMWFGLLVLWGILTAIAFPRYFANETQVMVLDRLAGVGVKLYPLKPLATNLTQSVYAVGQLACFLALRNLLDGPGRMVKFRDAVLLVAALDIAGAVINLAEYYVHIPSLLQYVRTAEGYSLAIEYESGGLVRIHGTFPEASLFAYYSLPMLAFCLSLWSSRVRPMYSGALTLMLLGLLLISTSGTAYVGLIGYGTLFVISELRKGKAPRLRILALAASCAAAVVLAIYVLELPAAQKLTNFVQSTLLDKGSSGSGQERASWNRQAWTNFLDTYGMGAGLGSARASSYPLVLLSNLGVVGVGLFTAFVARVLRKVDSTDLDPEDGAVQRAAREATIAALIGSTLAVGMFDLGVSFFLFSAAASMKPERAAVRESVAWERERAYA